MGCATPKPQLTTAQPQLTTAPAYAGTIAAIRPETASQDTTGSIQQIMTILGEPAPPSRDATEIVLHMADNTFRTNVQPPSPGLATGGKAALTPPPNVTIQPY